MKPSSTILPEALREDTDFGYLKRLPRSTWRAVAYYEYWRHSPVHIELVEKMRHVQPFKELVGGRRMKVREAISFLNHMPTSTDRINRLVLLAPLLFPGLSERIPRMRLLLIAIVALSVHLEEVHADDSIYNDYTVELLAKEPLGLLSAASTVQTSRGNRHGLYVIIQTVPVDWHVSLADNSGEWEFEREECFPFLGYSIGKNGDRL